MERPVGRLSIYVPSSWQHEEQMLRYPNKKVLPFADTDSVIVKETLGKPPW